MQTVSRIRIISEPAAAADFAEGWTAFAQAHPQPGTAFQMPGWLLPVMRMQSRKADASSRLCVVKDRKGPLLIAPLSIVERSGVRLLEWLGEPMVGYGDVLARPDCDVDREMTALLKHLRASNRDRIDVLHLRKVPQNAAVMPFLKARRLVPLTLRTAPYACLRGFASFEDYLETRNRRSIKSYRRKWRKLEALGPTEFRVLGPGPEAQALGRRALDMKIAWMKRQGLVSRTFTDQDRLEALIEILGHEGSGARIFALLVDDRPVALEIGFLHHKGYYSFIGAIDVQFAEVSPGNLQIMETMRWCLQQGAHYVDFLTPDSDYKRSWSTEVQGAADFCHGLTSRGRMYEALYIRRLQPWMVKLHRKSPSAVRELAKFWLPDSGTKAVREQA